MKIFWGVDYYPEHWLANHWSDDIKMMKEFGIQVVRLAEFAWSKIEIAETVFDFTWLDEVIELFRQSEIRVILGTPSAAPPIWLVEKEPNLLPLDKNGRKIGFGGRHHVCMSNPIYREYLKRFVIEIATHYKESNNIIGWQIDNELGNSHDNLCYCNCCKSKFHEWLERKYKEIKVLNESWGTVFWSQTYNHFGQIPVPLPTANLHNPSLLLDWKRFCADLVVEFLNFQVAIIRSICPNHFVTHNFMGFHNKTDYFALSESLDFVSADLYPTGYYHGNPYGQNPAELAAELDFIRSLKKKNYWMMELQSGATGGELIGCNPRPGQLRLWTADCIAHGGDSILYFRWRTCPFGSEQYWHGILPHWGIPDRRYYELKDTICDFTPVLNDIYGKVTKASVGILYSYDQNRAFCVQPLHPELSYQDQIYKYYNSLYELLVPVEFLCEKEDFTEYKCIIAPLQYIMTDALAHRLIQYVEHGGRLVLTMRTGVKDAFNVCISDKKLPGVLSELLGLHVIEYDCLQNKQVRTKWTDHFAEGTCDKWCDIIEVTTAIPLATYESDYYKGTPCITTNKYGEGEAYYIATEPDEAILGEFMKYLCKQTDITPLCDERQDNIEYALRQGAKNDYLFVLNHGEVTASLTIGKEWSLEIGEIFDSLKRYGVNVYAKPKNKCE